MGQLMLVNPRRRRRTTSKRRKTTAVAKRRRRSPSRAIARPARRIRRRRNPIASRGLMKNVIGSFQDGAIGSLGGIAASVVSGVLPLPITLKEGAMAPVVQGLIGIGTGMVVGKFMNRSIGEKMATGAVTIALHGTMKNLIGQVAPNLNLGGYDDGLLGAYDDGLLGAYDTDDLSYYTEESTAASSVGWTSSAPIVDDGMGYYSEY